MKKRRKDEKKLWEQYGFETEAEFRKKYPLAGLNNPNKKRKPKLGEKNSKRGIA